MFILQLNDMRSENVENLTSIARAETKEELEQYLINKKVSRYTDGKWGKNYRQHGPLEWCNPPYSHDQHIVDVGNEDNWADEARLNFKNQIMCIPIV